MAVIMSKIFVLPSSGGGSGSGSNGPYTVSIVGPGNDYCYLTINGTKYTTTTTLTLDKGTIVSCYVEKGYYTNYIILQNGENAVINTEQYKTENYTYDYEINSDCVIGLTSPDNFDISSVINIASDIEDKTYTVTINGYGYDNQSVTINNVTYTNSTVDSNPTVLTVPAGTVAYCSAEDPYTVTLTLNGTQICTNSNDSELAQYNCIIASDTTINLSQSNSTFYTNLDIITT